MQFNVTSLLEEIRCWSRLQADLPDRMLVIAYLVGQHGDLPVKLAYDLANISVIRGYARS